jgi:hypothetical protein
MYAPALALLLAAGCDDDPAGNNDDGTARDLVIVTNVISATSGAAFVGTIPGLTAASVDNQRAHEIAPYPYVFVRERVVLVTETGSSDLLKKFVPGPDGHLVAAGQLALGAGAHPGAVVWASDSKAYVALVALGRIAVVNPQTMTLIKTIDISGPRFAIGDNNPDPGQLLLHGGKLYVALQQIMSGPIAHDTADVLVINASADTAERVIRDLRTAHTGGEANTQKMFADENGDIYVVCIVSYGYGGTKPNGILRIRSGATTFDPTYFMDLKAISTAAGQYTDYINMAAYAGNGILYATANVPALMSNPPDFVNDYTFKALRIDLYNRTVTNIPLPLSNGYSAAVGLYQGKVLFGMSTRTGVGIFTYDPANGAVSSAPIVTTQGFPSAVRALNP